MKIIDLSGNWSFRLDEEKVGIKFKYYDTELEDHIILPATVSTAEKGTPSEVENTGYLTDPYLFEGYTWYSRELDVTPEEGTELFLVLERTRISHVWIGDQYVGSNQSLCTSHHYLLTPYITGKCKLTIMIDNTSYPVRGGHMTSPDTQTNWNGITGKIYLEERSKLSLTGIRIFPEASKGQIEVRAKLLGGKRAVASVKAYDEEKAFQVTEYLLQEGDNTLIYTLGDTAVPWSEFHPHLYHLQIILQREDGIQGEDRRQGEADGRGEEYNLPFGLREFKAVKDHFEINGIRTFLRGKHDGMIFPMTGHAPTDLDSWLKVMTTAKQYGMNHYRFHTCCPPEAAFAAADRLGIYMEPELPFWGTVTEEGEEQHDGAAQQFLIEEGLRILDEFGNHPSFVMMSLGNELWGSKERLNQILKKYRSYDPRPLYTQGSNNFQFVPCILENEDFFCGVRFSKDRLFRGSYAMCDAPQGHIQTQAPNSNHNYDQRIHPVILTGEVTLESSKEISGKDFLEKEVTIQYETGTKTVKADAVEELLPHVPVVSHEIGQYAMFPDFSEIEKYTGVLKARNLEVFQRRLAEKGLLTMADSFFRASGKFAADCYKAELETALRSRDLAGFQLLDLQDFTGQGTALIGMLNSFMESKGILSAKEWRQFCGSTVLLPELPRLVYAAGDSLNIGIKLAIYDEKTILNPSVELTLSDDMSILLQMQNIDAGEYAGGVYQLSDFVISLPETQVPKEYTVKIRLSGTEIENNIVIWSYPKNLPVDLSEVNMVNLEQQEAESMELVKKGCTETEKAFLATDCYTEAEEAVLVTDCFAEAEEALRQGGKVLLYLVHDTEEQSIPGTYCTDFWCYPMFRSISESMGRPVPVGTHGLLIDKEHPAFTYFPTREYTTAQWYDIVEHSRALILDRFDLAPMVWTIDNFERNHRLGNLIEVRSGTGKLLICTADLRKLTNSLPAKWLEYSILHYMMSDQFEPAKEFGTEELRSLLS